MFWLVKSIPSIKIKMCQNLDDLKNCNFSKLIQNCKKPISYPDIGANRLNSLFYSEIGNLIAFILIPIFGFLGLLTNFINILVLNKAKNDSNVLLLKLMKINSILNLISCLINLFHLLNFCISYSGLICSVYKRNVAVQYYDIYFIDFLGNILKSLSNIISVFISIIRYNSLKKINFIEKLINAIQKKFVKTLILICVFLGNIDKLFTDDINTNYYSLDYRDYYEAPTKNNFHILDGNTNGFEKPLVLKLYYSFFIFYFILNDVLLVITLFCFDLFMLVKFRNNLKKKKNLILKMNLSIHLNNDGKLQKLTNHETKITLIVFINVLTLLLIRSLEFTASFFIFLQKLIGHTCNSINKVCTNVLEFGNGLFLITCSYSIFVYFFLNKSFADSLISLFSGEFIVKK